MTLKVRLFALGTGIVLSLLLNVLNLQAAPGQKFFPHPPTTACSLHHP